MNPNFDPTYDFGFVINGKYLLSKMSIMKVLSPQIRIFERINLFSSLFKVLLVLLIALIVFLLTSRTGLQSSFGNSQEASSTTWQSNPPTPY
ncbi:MAG: hypothetical protein R3214_10040, partial [Christiangramia sp.]|nr:hypothetical protein [Christiangramia sp.]